MDRLILDHSVVDGHRQWLRENLSRLEKTRLVVVGDICIDEYINGEVSRLSPEAPVPVLDVRSQESRIGLAGNVAQNVVGLGGQVDLVSVTGQDEAGEQTRRLLQGAGVRGIHLISDPQRPTTRKTRVMAGHHHLVRVDFEKRKFLSPETQKLVLEKVESLLPGAQGLVLEDYGKGVFSEDLTQNLIGLAKKRGIGVIVDPHRTTPVRYYRGATAMKPNREEAFLLSGLNIDELRETPDSLARVAMKLREVLGLEHLVVTRGKEGMSWFSGGRQVDLPTAARQVFDVTGAGDTVLAALSLAVFSGFDYEPACVLANDAAGLVVAKVGCVPCSRQELLDIWSGTQ